MNTLKYIFGIFTSIKDIPSYLKLFFKALKFRSDITNAINTFPGISNTEILYQWCIDICDKLVDYATYTTFTEVDDYVTAQLRIIITDHWSIIEKAIGLLLSYQEIDTKVAQSVCDEIIAKSETSNPLLVVSIISALLNLISLIRNAKKNESGTETDGKATKSRPVLDALKKMLRKK
jgi:hypothetical protein